VRRRRLARFVRAWLFPLRKLETAAGWVQLLWLIALIVLPAGIYSAISKAAFPGSWETSWLVVAVLGALLVLALSALWRATPNPGLTLAFDRSTVQTPAAVDDHGNKVADARWFHFEVHSQANVRQCEGRLIRLERETGAGAWELVPGFKPPVHLSLDSVEGTRWPLIEPGLPARINLVFSQSNTAGAWLAVSSHRASGNLSSLVPDKYRLTVRVSAEGVEDVEGSFIVQVTGMWSGLDVAVAQ
jgi:hypothetical protein